MLGLSQTTIARKLGYERRWVSRLENGKTCIPLDMAPVVTEVLKLGSIEELLIEGRFSF